jgi:hypothetical protein
MAITPGKAGDWIRAIGSATWNTTENAIEFYHDYNVSNAMQKMAKNILVEGTGAVNQTVSSSTCDHNFEHVVDPSSSTSSMAEVMSKGLDNILETLESNATGIGSEECQQSIPVTDSVHLDTSISNKTWMDPTHEPLTSPSMLDHQISLSVSSMDSITDSNEPLVQPKPLKTKEMESFEIAMTLKKRSKQTNRKGEMDIMKMTSSSTSTKRPMELIKDSKRSSKRSETPTTTSLGVNESEMGTPNHNAKLTVSELKEKLRRLGLKVSGVKAELLDRINEYEGRRKEL